VPSFSAQHWEDLLGSIARQRCTVFLGAGASRPLPLGGELAEAIAARYRLLNVQGADLPRVAHYASLLPHVSDEGLRTFIEEKCRAAGEPDFANPDQLHMVLARLPFEYYATTNYDSFMTRALTIAGRPPAVEICQWHNARWDEATVSKEVAEPTVARPLVFHLHGAFQDWESMVLTEDDYLQFLTVTAANKSIIPSVVEKAFTRRLLFLGYGLEDMTFKVALRKLSVTMRRLQMTHLTVQLKPALYSSDKAGRQRRRIQEEYVKKILGSRAQIYWGSCEDFAGELRRRWAQRGQAAAA